MTCLLASAAGSTSESRKQTCSDCNVASIAWIGQAVGVTGQQGLRARKRQERRSTIESAAIDLFEARGFDGTTVEDIAAAADIAPRTFFHYFSTKEDVVLADYAARLERLKTELSHQPADVTPWAALRASFVVVAGDYGEQRDQLVRRFEIIAANPAVYARSLQLQAGWEDEVADALAERAHMESGDLDSGLMASAALACMRSSLRHWFVTGHDRPLPDLVQRCFDRFATGFAASA